MRESFKIFKDLAKDRPINAAEIGVRHGLNALDMLKGYNNMFLYLVDNYQEQESGKALPQMLERIKPYTIKCEFIHKESSEAAKGIPDGFLDYVYIDADHTYASVIADLNSWVRKVKIGGMVAGHDYWINEVSSAVNEFLLSREEGLAVITNQGNIPFDWFFIRRK